MSRIGKKPIPVPEGVTISVEPELVRVNGPRGELTERVPRDISVEQNDAQLLVKRPTDRAEHRALHGLTRSLVAPGADQGARRHRVRGPEAEAQRRQGHLEAARP